MPTALADLRAKEVSVVKRGANKQEFLIVKEDEGMSEALKKLDAVAKEAGLEGKLSAKVSKALEPVLKQVSDKAQAALQAALKLLDAVKDELPTELMAELMETAGLGNPKPAPVVAPIAQEGAPVMKSDGTWDFSKVPEGSRASVAAIYKERDEEKAKTAKIQKQLDEERDLRITKEFVEKAAGFDKLGVSKDELGQVMKALSEKSPDQFKLFEPMLKALDARVAKSDQIFKELGTSGGGNAPGGAYEKLEKLAKERVTKSTGADAKSFERHFTDVCKEHPELYREYEAEQAKPRG